MSKKTRERQRRRTTQECFACGGRMPKDYPWMICEDCCPKPGSIKRIGRDRYRPEGTDG